MSQEKNESNLSRETNTNIVLIGAPGSGKGTQSERLTKLYGICQISTGDLLRQAIKDESSLEGKSIRQTMKSGGLVDDKTVLSLIGTSLDEEKCRNGALFDGFPRTIHQGEELEKLLAARGKRLDAALEYAIDDKLLKQRILGRLIHPGSNRTYHEDFNPPKEPMKDDLTGEPLQRRSDDNDETLSARLSVYHKQTKPLIDFYRQRNLHHEIDATQHFDVITKKSIDIINQMKTSNSSNKTEPKRFGENFSFIYNSVTSVLRDRGLI